MRLARRVIELEQQGKVNSAEFSGIHLLLKAEEGELKNLQIRLSSSFGSNQGKEKPLRNGRMKLFSLDLGALSWKPIMEF